MYNTTDVEKLSSRSINPCLRLFTKAKRLMLRATGIRANPHTTATTFTLKSKSSSLRDLMLKLRALLKDAKYA